MSGKCKFDLGMKSDLIVFNGELKKTHVDLGDDKSADKIQLNSLNQVIKKKLVIYNFGKKDQLIVGDHTFDFDDLRESELIGLKVFFKGDGSLF